MPTALRENLVRLMNERGWNQTELARRSKVPQSTISRMITGHYGGGRWATIEALARALDVDPGELAGTKPPQPTRTAPTAATDSQIRVGYVRIGDLLPIYIASDWYADDDPSVDEMRWLAGLGVLTWTREPPTAETVHVLLTDRRAGKL